MEDLQDIEQMSFEEALEKLDSIVAALDKGHLPLEEAVTLFEQGNRLRLHCERKLATAKMRVEKILRESEERAPVLEPFFKEDVE